MQTVYFHKSVVKFIHVLFTSQFLAMAKKPFPHAPSARFLLVFVELQHGGISRWFCSREFL